MRSQTLPLMFCTLLWIAVAFQYIPNKNHFLMATAGIMMIYLYVRIELIKNAFSLVPEVASSTAQIVTKSPENQ
jgi:hypothetical protein